MLENMHINSKVWQIKSSKNQLLNYPDFLIMPKGNFQPLWCTSTMSQYYRDTSDERVFHFIFLNIYMYIYIYFKNCNSWALRIHRIDCTHSFTDVSGAAYVPEAYNNLQIMVASYSLTYLNYLNILIFCHKCITFNNFGNVLHSCPGCC